MAKQRSLSGIVIGRYRITEPIGKGGMSVVYAAVHEELGHLVAVKVLQPGILRTQEDLTRFFNEARAASVVPHPGIVRVLSFERLPDGAPCIVMEHLAGESLATRLKRHAGIGIPNALRLTAQLASALAAVHERGIIHRDLKPANVVLVPDPAVPFGERAKILDFGLAKMRDEHLRSLDDRVQTQTGTLLGTPAFMSPEQCRAEPNLTGATDVYALGLLLFVMRTGRLVFPDSGTMELIMHHLSTPPPTLSSIEPGAPAELTGLLSAMLAKEASLRPSMKEVEALVQRLADQEEEQKRNTLQAPAKGGRRLVYALLALVLLAGAMAVPYVASRPRGEVKRRWVVESQPKGADVLRATDGSKLGVTPWSTEGGPHEIILRKAGYFDRRVELQGPPYQRREVLQEITNAQIPLLR